MDERNGIKGWTRLRVPTCTANTFLLIILFNLKGFLCHQLDCSAKGDSSTFSANSSIGIILLVLMLSSFIPSNDQSLLFLDLGRPRREQLRAQNGGDAYWPPSLKAHPRRNPTIPKCCCGQVGICTFTTLWNDRVTSRDKLFPRLTHICNYIARCTCWMESFQLCMFTAAIPSSRNVCLEEADI